MLLPARTSLLDQNCRHIVNSTLPQTATTTTTTISNLVPSKLTVNTHGFLSSSHSIHDEYQAETPAIETRSTRNNCENFGVQEDQRRQCQFQRHEPDYKYEARQGRGKNSIIIETKSSYLDAQFPTYRIHDKRDDS
jgi:hypothetical protein